ncbi:Calx-beta domain-containing protein, partial [Pseudoteredinibacter isoporae]|uniref:Calx-beta domain-containing protein n=1 Tax=Pseudoteredinibacter isoporae TaxID=570281 RepID=UPI0033423FC8
NGNSSTTVTVPTAQDADFDNETFTATIDGVGTGANQFENVDTTTGANSRTPSAEATINDDDVAPTVSINDVTVNEDAGTMTFTVTLSNSTTQDVTFDYASSNGTATAGADYTAASGNGTITAGTTTTTITVPITDDFLREGDETLNMTLTNLSANTAASGHDLVGVGTIQDAGSPGQPETPQ